MGSQQIQAQLWGKRTNYWAAIQEATAVAGYDFALTKIEPGAGANLLDVGCGSGLFSEMGITAGFKVTAMDASEEMVVIAKEKVPEVEFSTGEMEDLPFDDETFDVVCGFNSFQYAADTTNALAEAKRVLKTGGKLIAMIWGNKEDCEAASYLKAVGGMMPPPPPGAPGPFALSENNALGNILQGLGFTAIEQTDVPATWNYPDIETALNGLMSAGPVSRAIALHGIEKVRETLGEAVKPYLQLNGHIAYQNKFRVVIAVK